PFDLLRHKIIPELVDRKTARSNISASVPMHIWSAACSTGQELYSIAIVIKDLMPEFERQKINLLPRLVGSDISDSAIARASAGKYNRFEIERGLPKSILRKYFTPDADHWKVCDELRAMVSFRKQNLLTGLNGLGRFDVIFCRNVAIYFSVDDRKRLFENIASALHPEGYLIIGSTESLTGITDRFEPKRHLRSVYYQLKKPA
ncbi:MAG: protein-glutamate O-methyltransferase CheR, partial [Deltaproteobacteria bacterium]|nr:protein-glutamate O-methyltransferase CheR [Deltaproteobacteria bacterium]